MVYNLDTGTRYASHVGLVVAVNGTGITVVSGNSGGLSDRVSTVTFVSGQNASGYASPLG